MAPSPSDFVHLHVHSEYSLLDGANRIKPMVEYVKSLGQTAMALTDHGVLFGALEFYKAARAAEIKPIMGCEVYITSGDRKQRGAGEQKRTHHLLLLAENYEGYRNICKLSSIGHTEGYYYKPRIDFEALEAHREGVIATSSCLAGLIPQAILEGNDTRAREYLGRFIDLFGHDRFFVELMDHGIRDQKRSNPALIEMARRENLKLIATNDAHYMRRSDAELHDVLLCVQTRAQLKDEKRFKFECDEFYLKSTDEMRQVFPDLPDAITNTRLVAEMCNVVMPEKEYRLPKFPTPNGETEAEYFAQRVWEGAHHFYGERADTDPELRERIQFEIDTIVRMGFPSYFLIVADFIDYARSVDIPVGPGRGSAAGSVVAYAMRITELDPLKHGLLFERFLNPDRLSMPDIDIDFCFERRGEVIEYVKRKYGEECVAQIITFGTMKAKLAVRDMGRVMDVPLDVVNRAAKAIPNDPGTTIEKAVENSEELRTMIATDPSIAKIVELARRTEGMVRQAGTHAAGVIIADQSINEYCPLFQVTGMERPATQFTMTEVEEDLGLLKMDFLGNKNLTIIKRVCDWLRDRDGVNLDWNKVPTDDPLTYELLGAGHTLGIFQLESTGMTRLVKDLRPSEFDDLTALLALFRPGPLGAGMHTMYVNRKHGREEVRFDHPILEPILGETYGVVLYQEQVMRIAMAMCGFTRGEADVLRKAMGKKKLDVMAKLEEKWADGAPKTSGVPRDLALKIWADILNFASYGFNKSHSAAYAVVTFQTAYLRAHYPVYFLAALLTNEIGGGTESIARYVSHTRSIGIDVKPVDINNSRPYFNPDPANNCIYYAINGLKGVGTEFANAVVRERDANGPFADLQDFIVRMPREHVNMRTMEILVKIGAFDSMDENRPGLLAALPEIISLAQDIRRSEQSAITDMFAEAGADEDSMVPKIHIPRMEPWDDKTRGDFEKEILGFNLIDHPFAKFEIEMESFCDLRAAELEQRAKLLRGDEKVRITMMGFVTEVIDRVTKKGDPWCVVKMEDLSGEFEVKLFPRAMREYRDVVDLERVLQMTCTLSLWNDKPSLEAVAVRAAEDLRSEARGVSIRWKAEELTSNALFELGEICRRFPGTKGMLLIIDADESCEVQYTPELRLALTPSSVEELRGLPGFPRVRYIPGRIGQASNDQQRERGRIGK